MKLQPDFKMRVDDFKELQESRVKAIINHKYILILNRFYRNISRCGILWFAITENYFLDYEISMETFLVYTSISQMCGSNKL